MMESGLRELVEYANGLAAPNFEDYGEIRYSDKKMHQLDFCQRATAIEMSTLTGLVDYIKAQIDDSTKKMIVQVMSPTEVALISALDNDRKRETLVSVAARVPDFRYGRYMSNEEFIIALQSKFIGNDDRDLLLKFAGTVKNESIAQYGDDGVSQKARDKKYWMHGSTFFNSGYVDYLDCNFPEAEKRECKQKPIDRFSVLPNDFRMELANAGVIEGQSVVYGKATQEQLRKMREAGVI